MFIMASVGSINDKKLSKISRHCHFKKSKCTHFSKKLQFLVYTSSGVYSLKYFLGQKRIFVPKEPKRKAQSLKTAFLGFSPKNCPTPPKTKKLVWAKNTQMQHLIRLLSSIGTEYILRRSSVKICTEVPLSGD